MNALPEIYRAKEAATMLLQEFGIRRPSQIRLEEIAWERKVLVTDEPMDGAAGWLFRDGQYGLIRVNSRVRDTGRRRFSIAHELGHWECHMGQSQAYICTSGDIHSYRGSNAEIEANTFAAQLLMPRALIAERVKYADVGVQAALGIAEEFQVSLTAAAIRLVEESKEPCAVVMSHNNLVVWTCRSNTGVPFYLSRSTPIHEDSFAFDCQKGLKYSRGTREVESSAWLSGRAAYEYEVLEESVLLEDYDLVLTFLSFVESQ